MSKFKIPTAILLFCFVAFTNAEEPKVCLVESPAERLAEDIKQCVKGDLLVLRLIVRRHKGKIPVMAEAIAKVCELESLSWQKSQGNMTYSAAVCRYTGRILEMRNTKY